MAAITPPEGIPQWDTGDNNSTDPGTAKKAAGWALNEVPSSAHMNWLHQQQGEWIEFLSKVCAPEIFRRNSTYTSNQMFTTPALPEHYHIIYNDTLGKYLATARNSLGDGYAYDSADGITWGNEFTAIASPVSRVASDGVVIVCFMHESALYTSSTGSTAGLTFRGALPAGLRTGWDVVYDATNGYYIATGAEFVCTLNNSTANVHTPADWVTTRNWAAESVEGIAVSPTGVAVITFIGTGSATSTDGGQTWSAKAGANNFGAPIYSPASDCFFAYDRTANLLYFKPNSAGTTWTDTGLNIVGLIVHENVTIGIAAGPPHLVYAFNQDTTASLDTGYAHIMSVDGTLGTAAQYIDADLAQGLKTDGYCRIVECIGNAPNLVWPDSNGDTHYAKMR